MTFSGNFVAVFTVSHCSRVNSVESKQLDSYYQRQKCNSGTWVLRALKVIRIALRQHHSGADNWYRGAKIGRSYTVVGVNKDGCVLERC